MSDEHHGIFDDAAKRWRSDVDSKLDSLILFMQASIEREKMLQATITELKATVSELHAVLQAGRGGLWLFFTISKVMAAFGVIGAALYGIRRWMIG